MQLVALPAERELAPVEVEAHFQRRRTHHLHCSGTTSRPMSSPSMYPIFSITAPCPASLVSLSPTLSPSSGQARACSHPPVTVHPSSPVTRHRVTRHQSRISHSPFIFAALMTRAHLSVLRTHELRDRRRARARVQFHLVQQAHDIRRAKYLRKLSVHALAPPRAAHSPARTCRTTSRRPARAYRLRPWSGQPEDSAPLRRHDRERAEASAVHVRNRRGTGRSDHVHFAAQHAVMAIAAPCTGYA